ncbi:MAG: hypothetical protein Q8L98_08575 [Chlamydiales bacterium]|nr:hypothetical protein [Chlamydiales bacterium]
MKLILLCLLPFCLYGLVYDCFPFFNELELLQVRFAELDETVDYFVLVESVETQRGDLKPLFFKENKHLFEKYLPKVIHVIIDERHPEMGLWEREHYQRNAMMRALEKRATSSDVVIISDLDEIPRGTVIAALKQAVSNSSPISVKVPPFTSKKAKKKYKKRYAPLKAYALEMDNYYYQLNRQTSTKETWDGGMWCGTIMTTYAQLKKRSPQYFRKRRNKLPRIAQGGWHFSWMGGKDKIRQKLVSVVEGRSDGALVTDEEIAAWIAKHPAVPLDDSFPKYILEKQDHFRSIGFLAD